jgi:hypothetical protein
LNQIDNDAKGFAVGRWRGIIIRRLHPRRMKRGRFKDSNGAIGARRNDLPIIRTKGDASHRFTEAKCPQFLP